MNDAPQDDISIDDLPDQQRYVIRAQGKVAGRIDYELQGERMALVHTEVQPEYEGTGLGARLARFALDDARRRGLRVVPSCGFIAAYVHRHPEYEDLMAA